MSQAQVNPKNHSCPMAQGGWKAGEMAIMTETSFIAEISIMIAVNTYLNLLGVKGNVAEKPNQILGINLTDLGEYDPQSNDYDWKNRTNDAVEFEALYQGYLATSLPKDFDAEYVVTGNRMDLIVAAVNDTIVLFKK